MPIPDALRVKLDDLSMLTDRADRIEVLLAIGDEYKNYSADLVPRTPETRVPGCESEVFFRAEPLATGQRYLFAVDNPQGVSAMALAVILEAVSGAPLDEVASISEDVVYEIFGRELSMGKSMGLTAMVRMLRDAAKQ
jgi:cysteine desulfuration protein SufE